MGESSRPSKKGPFAGLLSQPSNPQTPQRAARKAGVSEPGSFSPRRPLEQASDKEKQIRMRAMIAKRMKEETLCCTDEHFVEHYLPPIPGKVKIATIVKDLAEGKHLQKSEAHKQDLLGDFSIKPTELRAREGSRTNEKIIFAPLGDVSAAIRDSVGTSQNAFPVRMVHDKELSSQIPGCSFKIDACATASKLPPGTLHLTDIVVPFEFKISNTAEKQQENRLQLVSAVVHIMNDDVRRNFIFGITIENDRVSLWYFSRTHSVKATSFSYVENPEKLAYVLTALSCATKEQLGFDPRITLLDDKSYLYEFPATEKDSTATVTHEREEQRKPTPPSTTAAATTNSQAVYFRTSTPLGEVRAFRVAGRTTRVFKGKQVISKENPTPVAGAIDVVVKDVWIGADSPTEVQIQQQLFDDIEDFAKSPEKDWKKHPLLEEFDKDIALLEPLLTESRYKEFFLRAVRESVGERNLPVHPEAWDSDQIFTTKPPLVKEAPAMTTGARTGTTPATTAPPPPLAGGDRPSLLQAFSPKKRCFFLFEEVCTRVSELPTLGEAMDVLRQTHLALILMFCAGWVHRDISSGNVLAVRKEGEVSWQAKLADLEYARKFPSDDAASTDPKTGTPYFMAWEIQSALSLFDDEPRSDNLSRRRKSMEGGGDNRQLAVDLNGVKTHTYAHDLESLWWLIIWIACCLIGHHESYSHASVLFIGSNNGPRLRILSGGGLPVLHPDLEGFVRPLKDVRNILMAGYRKRNPAAKPEVLKNFSGACSTYLDFFDTIRKSQATWGFIPLNPAPNGNEVVDTLGAANATQVSGATQSHSKKRKVVAKPSAKETSRGSTQLAATIPSGSKPDEPGPSKRARR